MSAAAVNAGARSLSISGGINHSKAPAKFALSITSLLIPFAALAIPVLAYRNGHIPLLEHLELHGPHYVPGSTPHVYTQESSNAEHPSYPTAGDQLLRTFTGVEAIDHMLTVMNCFFGPVLRSHELGVLTLHFAGGLAVVLGLMNVEAERNWTGWKKVFKFPTLWALAFQALSFGFTFPIYATLYLLASLTGPIPSIPVTATPRIKTLIPSLALGYIGPTAAIALTHFFGDSVTNQQVVAAWQIFPVYIALLQLILPAVLPFPATSYTSLTAQRDELRSSLKTIYDTLRFIQSTTHIASLFYITRIILPDPSLDLLNIILPANPFLPEQVKSMTEGTMQFLQWDYGIGMLAAAAWMLGTSGGVKDGVRKVFMGVFEGLGTVLSVLAQEREERIWVGEDAKKN